MYSIMMKARIQFKSDHVNNIRTDMEVLITNSALNCNDSICIRYCDLISYKNNIIASDNVFTFDDFCEIVIMLVDEYNLKYTTYEKDHGGYDVWSVTFNWSTPPFIN